MFIFASTDAIYAQESSAHWLVQRYDAPIWFTIGVDLTEDEAQLVLNRILARDQVIERRNRTQYQRRFRIINKYIA